MEFVTNHLGHFYLTNRLLDKMKETAKSTTGIQDRIVNLSSVGHGYPNKGGTRFHNINNKSSQLSRQTSTWAIQISQHITYLSRHLQEKGANITANSGHPGLIMTPFMRHSALLMRIFRAFTCFLWKNVPQLQCVAVGGAAWCG